MTTVADPIIGVLKATADNANALALKIKGATSGLDEKISEFLTNSTDPEIVAWRQADEKNRAQIAAAQAKVDEAKAAATARAKSMITTEDVDVEALKKQYLTERAQAKTLRDTITIVLGGDAEAAKTAIEAAGVVEIVNLGRGTSGATTGAPKSRKPRLISASVNGEDVEKPTFTILAQKIGADLDTVKSAAFTAAGVEFPAGDLSEKAGQEFSFSVTNKKNETVNVKFVPKASGSEKSDEETVVTE